MKREIDVHTQICYNDKNVLSHTHGCWPITHNDNIIHIDELIEKLNSIIYFPDYCTYKLHLYFRPIIRTRSVVGKDLIDICSFQLSDKNRLSYEQYYENDIINIYDIIRNYDFMVAGEITFNGRTIGNTPLTGNTACL